MPNVEARLKVKGQEYQISVDVDEAFKVQKGSGDVSRALNYNAIYTDLKKGEVASQKELQEAFGTSDVFEIAKKIMVDGEIQKPQEYRDAEREAKINQVVALIVRNAVDQNGRPYTEERIRRAISEIHFNFDKRPAEIQMQDVLHKLKEVIPIRVDTKKIRLTIPAQYTGQVYGIINDYKEKEDWQNNGNLVVIVNIPAGMQLDFYDKLNGVTHGAIQSEEINE